MFFVREDKVPGERAKFAIGSAILSPHLHQPPHQVAVHLINFHTRMLRHADKLHGGSETCTDVKHSRCEYARLVVRGRFSELSDHGRDS